MCGNKIEKKDLKLASMFIDIGASNLEEAQQYVQVGDVCTFVSNTVEIGQTICSGALDNRIGCYVLIEVLKLLKQSPYDLYFVFTVQEELGLRGARPSAYAIAPDIGLSIDVAGVGDMPDSKATNCKLGGGAAIKIKDASILTHPSVRDWLIECAKVHHINYQLEVSTSGGTDGGAIHVSRGGAMTGGISIPARYIHSSCECVNRRDVENCIALLAHALSIEI